MELSSEISSIKEQVRNGRFDVRISPSALTDGTGDLARLMNEILDLYEQEIRKVTKEHEARAGEYKESLSYASESLKSITGGMKSLAEGDLTKAIKLPRESQNTSLNQSVRDLRMRSIIQRTLYRACIPVSHKQKRT